MFDPRQIKDLAAPLIRSNVKTRSQAGRQLSYIEGWHAIAEANRIFGFDAWDREMIDMRLVSEAPCFIGKDQKPGFRVGYIARVRIIVNADGTKILRDGTGYGSGIDADVGNAHESAVKEAETDAMKRALMTFGNPFGLALYDKEQSEVENAPRPQNASANGATRQASTAGSRVQTAKAPQNSPAGAGPTATKAASPSEAPPFPGDQPSGDEHARPMSEAGREFLAAIRQRISAAKLPSKIDDLIKANGGGLSRLHEESAQAYEDLMMFANSAKQEMLAGTG